MTPHEKPKGKSNPFASYIRPTEEILWLSKQQVTMQELMPTRTILALVVFFLAFIVIALLVMYTNPQLSRGEVVVGTLAIILLVGLRMLSRRSNRRLLGSAFAPSLGDHAMYAITSERLFFQRGQDLRALPLEKVPTIKVQATGEARGTLLFGTTFPMWTGVQDAEQVKDIIEQARQTHKIKRTQSS